MFTVIIAQKEHIEKIQEYELFLRPFLATGDVVFCQWHIKEERLADMLPDLANLVGRRKEWRALIVCNEDGLHQQNPFDLVKTLPRRFEGSVRGTPVKDLDKRLAEQQETEQNLQNVQELDDAQGYKIENDMNNIYSEEYKQFLQEEHERKLQAYDEAAKNPLTRLVTFFCNTPTVTKQMDSVMVDGDPDYVRYIIEHQHKQALREQILDGEEMETFQPTDVVCLAKRTYSSNVREFDNVWSSHTEMEYSRFFDRNMYFEKMRYLVFDILPSNQRDYMFDYIRFLYATILLASNEIPSACLATERVYKLECENDEAALCTLLQTYEAKLNLTKETLNQRIRQLQEKKPHVLTDYEAQKIFCAQVNQSVTLDSSFSEDELRVKPSQIGLANGCKRDEAILWNDEYHRVEGALSKMLKQSRRALKRATKTAREQQDVSLDRINCLNDFQLEDIQEYTDNQELAMLNVNTVDLYDEEAFHVKMEEADRDVKAKVKTRMYRNTTLALGGLACLMFLLGFFTVFLDNLSSNFLNFTTSLIIVGVSLGVFALAALITLFFLRGGLVKHIHGFNRTMEDVGADVYGAMAQYSKYLSHMSNVRRGYAVLNAVATQENPDHNKIILYKKHIVDIEKATAEVRMVFGHFMVGSALADTDRLSAYDYNFNAPVDYEYPLPYTDGTTRKITFIQTGVTAKVPVEFVKRITVRREELYE